MMMMQAQVQSRVSAARVQPFVGIQRPKRTLLARANDSNNGVVGATTTTEWTQPLAPEWHEDRETIKDVFAFAGPAPERVNGRLAMYGFAAIAFTELQQHTPALEQFGQQWFTVIFLSLLITVGSLLPKLASGMPLKDLHASATSENMAGKGWKQVLGFFDQNVELWTGRVAMIGVLGLVVNEVIRGDSFF